MRTLFILRGAPASGKSTWIQQNNLEPYTLCADTIRLMYQCPITQTDGQFTISQNNDRQVWELLLNLLEQRMQNGEFVIIDATHYKAPLIAKYKDLVTKYRYRMYIVDFTSSVTEQELIERNKPENRGFKSVPEDVIHKMWVALQDTNELKKSYKILTPKEASNLITDPLQPFELPDNYNKVVIFGDIHGCYMPLKKYFDNNPFDKNTNYIFTGDYIDRGLQNKETLEFLLSICHEPNVMLLEGNHELWLRIYSDKDYRIQKQLADYRLLPETDEINPYKDFYIQKILSELQTTMGQLKQKVKSNNKICQDLSDLLKEEWENGNTDITSVFYRFENVNVRETQQRLNAETKELNERLEKLKDFCCILKHEEHNTKEYINYITEWYNERFENKLSKRLRNILCDKFDLQKVPQNNIIHSLTFLKNTYPQIKDIDFIKIRQLCYKLAQMSYLKIADNYYVITHGGVPCVPKLTTQTQELIHGVGNYDEHVLVDENFVKNMPSNYYQVHGHRNTHGVDIVSKDGRTFNLENKIEFGGTLRILEIIINRDNNNNILDIKHNPIEIKNEIYLKAEDFKESPIFVKEKTNLEILKDMLESPLIQVKKNLSDPNILSFNFTRDAFHNKKWNDLTCTARGLFVDKRNGNIIACSFNKFFNKSERQETKTEALKQTFKFPVVGYRKENGFLSLITKYQGEIKFFTKSTDQGDFVNWFIGVLCDKYKITPDYVVDTKSSGLSYSQYYNLVKQELTQEQQTQLDLYVQKLKNILQDKINEGYTYIFECVDQDNDPHIIKYNNNEVYLLAVRKNSSLITPEFIDYVNLRQIANNLQVPVKTQELLFNTWEEFIKWKTEFTEGITQWNCKHEGYVLQDANGYMVKFKSSFYNFWKQMRSVKDKLQKGTPIQKRYITKEEIQVIQLLKSIKPEELANMSIIDIEEQFYKDYQG